MGSSVSSGVNNDDLTNNLRDNQYIKSSRVEQIFRAVDRGAFASERDAYEDLAWREDVLHMSAPSIYANVMEELELEFGQSFLNLGSGTGYLSLLVGHIVGPQGLNHGVEVQQRCVEYARNRVNLYLSTSPHADKYEIGVPEFFVGNFLALSSDLHGRYDRVYCGSAVDPEMLAYIRQFLKPGGILVLPVDDQLLKVRRESDEVFSSTNIMSVSFASAVPASPECLKSPLCLPLKPVPKLVHLCRLSIRRLVRDQLYPPDAVKVSPKEFTKEERMKKKRMDRENEPPRRRRRRSPPLIPPPMEPDFDTSDSSQSNPDQRDFQNEGSMHDPSAEVEMPNHINGSGDTVEAPTGAGQPDDTNLTESSSKKAKIVQAERLKEPENGNSAYRNVTSTTFSANGPSTSSAGQEENNTGTRQTQPNCGNECEADESSMEFQGASEAVRAEMNTEGEDPGTSNSANSRNLGSDDGTTVRHTYALEGVSRPRPARAEAVVHDNADETINSARASRLRIFEYGAPQEADQDGGGGGAAPVRVLNMDLRNLRNHPALRFLAAAYDNDELNTHQEDEEDEDDDLPDEEEEDEDLHGSPDGPFEERNYVRERLLKLDLPPFLIRYILFHH